MHGFDVFGGAHTRAVLRDYRCALSQRLQPEQAIATIIRLFAHTTIIAPNRRLVTCYNHGSPSSTDKGGWHDQSFAGILEAETVLGCNQLKLIVIGATLLFGVLYKALSAENE